MKVTPEESEAFLVELESNTSIIEQNVPHSQLIQSPVSFRSNPSALVVMIFGVVAALFPGLGSVSLCVFYNHNPATLFRFKVINHGCNNTRQQYSPFG